MSDTISHIYRNIFISNYKQSVDLNSLYEYDIRAILYIGDKQKPEEVLNVYTKHLIVHRFIQIPNENNANISSCFDETFKFIDSHKDVNVLVHCQAGVSYSPTVVAHYLIKVIHDHIKRKNENRQVCDEVLGLIGMYRPCIQPSPNFIKQLKFYDDSMMI